MSQNNFKPKTIITDSYFNINKLKISKTTIKEITDTLYLNKIIPNITV
jgi:hypothetical protein